MRENIPEEKHDLRMGMVISENGIYRNGQKEV